MRLGMTLLGAGLVVRALSAQTPAEDPLLRWMDRIAQGQLDARDKEIAAVRTVADAERRKVIVRRKIMSALGGLPDYDGPLNPRITGRIQANGYVIEKVIYESLPRFYVTANLYRPDRPGRYPAVLLQAGHTQEGKAEPQWLAANLRSKASCRWPSIRSVRENGSRPTIRSSKLRQPAGRSTSTFTQEPRPALRASR